MISKFSFLFAFLFLTISCNADSGNNDSWNSSNNVNNSQEICDNNIDDDGDGYLDCEDFECVSYPGCSEQNNNNHNTQPKFTLTGKIMAPGSDDAQVLAENRVPVYEALVAAYGYEPDPLPEGSYCNECVEVPQGVIHTFTEADGTFELELYANKTYWITVQKGDFRRVTQYTTGDDGQSEDFSTPVTQASDHMVTLPNSHDPSHGAWIPKILVIKGMYEEMEPMFSALGFAYGVEVKEVTDMDAEYIAADINELRKYNLIITTCGDDASYLNDSQIAANLKQYVEEGGKLYVDDFSYDWAEQPFPEFLSFYDGSTECGSGSSAPSTIGTCNHWSQYDPTGTPGDQKFEEWLNVINPNSSIDLLAAWDIIETLNPGLQGDCSQDDDPDCVNGQFIKEPKVWMYGSWSGYTDNPVTVSWNYYCGKVLYTVYHTHSGSSGGGYNYSLLLQEKIMLYLIMEIQTCTVTDIVE
ncbi:MAG: hypothetical protein PF689_02450 [Deltaproteobacteria bacterium]|jgi:hypothetical protein|nr:hypothetical protein [Deltaproteobacteria bacterium]